MSSNNGGPWGGGSRGPGGGNGDDGRPGSGGNRPRGGDQPQIPEIEDIVRKGQEQLRALMGGRGGNRANGPGGGGGAPQFSRGTVMLALLGVIGVWLYLSVYAVKPEERSVELMLGKFSSVGEPGLNFAPWPIITFEKVQTTRERVEQIGAGGSGRLSEGLMLTSDENIVDIDFQIVWNITDPAQYLFHLRDPAETINAVAEAAMREIIAQSRLAPILNRDRGIIASKLRDLVQSTLDSYDAGIRVVRVNFDKADPPKEVIDSFRQVQAAEQERDRLEKEADAYANTVLGAARGNAAQILEEAEAYRAQVVNDAEGEASRFSAVLAEYLKAPEVTRQRLYIETMERVLGDVDKILLEPSAEGAQGVVPYLPLNELRPSRQGANTQGGNN